MKFRCANALFLRLSRWRLLFGHIGAPSARNRIGDPRFFGLRRTRLAVNGIRKIKPSRTHVRGGSVPHNTILLGTNGLRRRLVLRLTFLDKNRLWPRSYPGECTGACHLGALQYKYEANEDRESIHTSTSFEREYEQIPCQQLISHLRPGCKGHVRKVQNCGRTDTRVPSARTANPGSAL
jgi:hypothetical protein